MAISLSTGLVPYLGRGDPYVVVKGQFVPDLVSVGPNAYQVAARLCLFGVTAGTPSSLTVSGRASPGSYFDPSMTLGDYVADSPDMSDWGSGQSSVYGDPGGDAPASVRMLEDTDDDDSYGSVSAATAGFRGSYGPYFGKRVSEEVTIVFRGELGSLNLSRIRAFTTVPISTGAGFGHTSLLYAGRYGYNDQRDFETPLDSGYRFNFPDYGPGAGWRMYEVHVYDQPFRSVTVPWYFTAYGKSVQWD